MNSFGTQLLFFIVLLVQSFEWIHFLQFWFVLLVQSFQQQQQNWWSKLLQHDPNPKL